MKCVYIDCTEFGQSVLTPAILARLPGVVVHAGDPDAETLISMMAGAVGVINGHTLMDAALLERSEALRTIVFLGTGASTYIDLPAAKRLGITVRTVQGYGDRTIAEHAFALILAGARGVARMDREIRRGEWIASVGVELAGKRLGVIGTGGIGRELIRMADAFGMEVVAWNRSGVSANLPCTELALDDLIETSHVVSLHLALNDDTRGLLDRARLERLRPDAIVVNVARGALIDEAALVDLQGHRAANENGQGHCQLRPHARRRRTAPADLQNQALAFVRVQKAVRECRGLLVSIE